MFQFHLTFLKIHFSGNLPNKFTSPEDDYSIHLKLNPPGPLRHNELFIWRLLKPTVVWSSCPASCLRFGKMPGQVAPCDMV